MTRIVVNPLELRRTAGLLEQCAEDADLGEQRLRTTPLPELPDGFGWVPGELQAIAGGLRRQGIDLHGCSDDLTRRAIRIEADQARLMASLRLLQPNACLPAPSRHESYWQGVRHRAGLLWRFVAGDDLHTIRDPKQPWWERGIAVLSILPVGKGLKAARIADDALRAERDAKIAADAARAARVTRIAEKSRYTLVEWRALAGSRSRASRELEANLRTEAKLRGEKLVKPTGYEPHHIVAAFDPKAERAQRLLARWGIPPNDAANGVYLPGPLLKDAHPLPTESFHRPLHTRIYYAAVYDELRRAKSTRQAVEIMAAIARRLETGKFPS